jgi:hypothetical protein
MRDVFKKIPPQETTEIISNTSNQEAELPEKETEQTQQVPDSTIDANTLELLESLQKVNAEEQKLLEIKQNLLQTQKTLQNSLVNEIDKKKKTIANLVSEIPTLQNKCEQIGQALGIDIYNL